MRQELAEADGGTRPSIGQPASGDPNAWAAGLPAGVDVRVFRGRAFSGQVEGDDLKTCVDAGEPIEALILDQFGPGRFTLRPQINGAMRPGVRLSCGDVDAHGNLIGADAARVELMQAKLEAQEDRAKDREALIGLTAAINAQQGSGGIDALGKSFEVIERIRADPVTEQIKATAVERMMAPPVPVATAPAAKADDSGDVLRLITEVVRNVGAHMQSPAGAFAGAAGAQPQTVHADPPPDAPPPDAPPPAHTTEPATPVHPPRQVEADADREPDPVDVSVHTQSALDDLPQDQAALVGGLVQGAQRAAADRNAPALAEILYRFLNVCAAAGVNEAQRDQVERDPGAVVDDLANFIDVDAETLAEARALVIEDMAELVAERAAADAEAAAAERDAAQDDDQELPQPVAAVVTTELTADDIDGC